MLNYFKSEFKRLFISINTLIAMLMVIVCLIIPYIDEVRMPWPGADGIIYFIRIGACLPYSYLPAFAPLIACIVSANSYIADKNSLTISYIITRIERKKYFKIRLLINILISGLVLLIPEILMLLFLIICHGLNNNTTIEVVGAFSSIFSYSKVLYVTILLMISFIFGSVFSTFALGISAIVENRYLTILLPYVYVIISGTIFAVTGINNVINLNVITLFDIGYSLTLTGINVIMYDLVLFLIGCIMFFYFGERKNHA